ncbi:uncharacterized protein [Palaemon carinicauda]|uniref:uncharacterized protein n=1 Tax=Palaemon carinicauda TaxID=392227 RepID=UPI0035B620FC
MTSISSLLVLLMLVFNSHARSLNYNDVPARSKNISTRMLPLRAAYFGKATLANTVEEAVVMNSKRKSKPMPVSSTFESAIPTPLKQTKRLLPVHAIKFKSPVRGNHQEKDEISFQRREHPEKPAVTPEQVKVKTEKVLDEIATTEGGTAMSTEASDFVVTSTTEASVVTSTTEASVVISTTKASIITSTTTEDPWESFCNQACGTGDGGPECRCAGHPVG